ncbi:MAG TPA: GNAT family N-acetyltransferase [Gemmatimonas sp.]|uniref:GNAT family N-acetyltransferase n=1 Tax=Gemmatimonas sp. TaxID=1962908 RepID=UPI002EDAB878
MTRNADLPMLSDRALARRLERCEAHANAAFVDARAVLSPEIGAIWQDVDGTWAMFDGVGSPLTQTFGLGLFADATARQFESLEQFFGTHGTEVMHEVCVMADPGVLALLGARGYQPVEWSQVLCQPLSRDSHRDAGAGDLVVRRTTADAADHWADVSAEGWSSEGAELVPFIRALGRINARAADTHCFVAELEGRAVAAGALHLHEGVALLAGASTIPSARGRGAQRALLDARLQFAADAGCDLAMMATAPGSTSQKNSQRAGFDVVYSRVKWMQARPVTTP